MADGLRKVANSTVDAGDTVRVGMLRVALFREIIALATSTLPAHMMSLYA